MAPFFAWRLFRSLLQPFVLPSASPAARAGHSESRTAPTPPTPKTIRHPYPAPHTPLYSPPPPLTPPLYATPYLHDPSPRPLLNHSAAHQTDKYQPKNPEIIFPKSLAQNLKPKSPQNHIPEILFPKSQAQNPEKTPSPINPRYSSTQNLKNTFPHKSPLFLSPKSPEKTQNLIPLICLTISPKPKNNNKPYTGARWF